MRRVGPPADAGISGSPPGPPQPNLGCVESSVCRVHAVFSTAPSRRRVDLALLASASSKAPVPTRYHALVPALRSRTASSARSATTSAVKDETEMRILLLNRLGQRAALPLSRHALGGRAADPRFEAHGLYNGVYVLCLRAGPPISGTARRCPARDTGAPVRASGARQYCSSCPWLWAPFRAMFSCNDDFAPAMSVLLRSSTLCFVLLGWTLVGGGLLPVQAQSPIDINEGTRGFASTGAPTRAAPGAASRTPTCACGATGRRRTRTPSARQ